MAPLKIALITLKQKAYKRIWAKYFILGLLFGLTACSTSQQIGKDGMRLKPTTFSHLPDWPQDRHNEALDAFKKSCSRLLKTKETRWQPPKGSPKKSHLTAWHNVCRKCLQLPRMDKTSAKQFFETHFEVYQVTHSKGEEGLFTGYYVPTLRGSLYPTERFRYPLYAVPPEKYLSLSRHEIDRKGKLNGKGLELVYVDDPVMLSFLHVQGSGEVVLQNGRKLYLGYAGKNKHPFRGLGKTMRDRGIKPEYGSSLQAIAKWLNENPKQRDDLLDTNPSYVFFRILPNSEIVGAQGVGLMALRSLAIDPYYYSYGTPIWVDLKNPPNQKHNLRRLMVAQDTGGAIKGVIRGDVFWGAGDKAEWHAGHMKSLGASYVFLPK